MIIGFDRTFAEINQAGTGVYVGSLAKALKESSQSGTMFFLSAGQKRDISKKKTLRTRLDTLYRDLLWMHVILPMKVRQLEADLLHMPANLSPIASPCPVVLSVLDTILYQSPQNFPVWQRNYFRFFGPRSAHSASHIITISEASKQDILNTFRVPPEKVSAIPIAVSPEFAVLNKESNADIKNRYELGSYIFTVGAIEPRKNLLRLVEAFEGISKSFPNLTLVHAGPYGWHMDRLAEMIEEKGLSKSVRFLGKVSLKDLVQLYNAADLFIYPSLYEGFGLPILEAMSSGCPVITSNISSMPEVAGDASILVDPFRTSAIENAICEVLTQPEIARDLRQKGLEQAKKFSWQRCAEETIKVYMKVLGK